jgi:hypothetical protein
MDVFERSKTVASPAKRNIPPVGSEIAAIASKDVRTAFKVRA